MGLGGNLVKYLKVAMCAAAVTSAVEAQTFSRYDIIEGLARPGGIAIATELAPRTGNLQPLKLDNDATGISDEDGRKALSDLLSAYLPPSVDLAISFRLDSAEIDPSAYDDLSEVAQALSSPQLVAFPILVAGHTDAVGGAKYNLDLSYRRAASVRRHLNTVHGISEKRLIITGFGYERLKDFIFPEAAINRRVEFMNAVGLFQ